ncbi:MAG: hypothetical protein HS117_24330 [Verrucomicrobiaceae bacterium]|nr:hypothetical protein [Verrucomicrobiaceae bacterium]
MSATRAWLADFTWEVVTAQNAVLCAAKNALHKPTSDGHAETKALWDLRHPQVMSLDEAVDLCRQCHRKAPFCFYNGNTFASIIALVIKKLALPADEAFIIRSLAGHIVAGVATEEEVRAFREFCERLDQSHAG